MDIVASDRRRGGRRGRKRKQTTLNNNGSSTANLEEEPPRAIGIDGHFYECVKCNQVGSLICCDICACTYHFECHDPPLESVPEGDWFCCNCIEEVESINSDSTMSATTRRRRTLKRACKTPTGCCLCSTIKKKLVPDQNHFFSFKSKSTPQSNLANRRRQPSTRNNDAVGTAIIQHNTNNNGDKRVLRPRKRAEGNQIVTRKSGRNTTTRTAPTSAPAPAPAQAQNNNNDQNVPKRMRRGRRGGKRNGGEGPSSSVAPQQNDDEAQNQQAQKPCLAMVLYGQKDLHTLPHVEAAIRAAEEAGRNKATEMPWSEIEIDALWVGVRRHGPNKWEEILSDPNLKILSLCKKTPLDLSLRWQKELQLMTSIVKSSGFLLPTPHHHRQPPLAFSNGEAPTVQQPLLPPPPQQQNILLISAESAPLVPPNHPHRQVSSSSSSSSLRAHPHLSIPAAVPGQQVPRARAPFAAAAPLPHPPAPPQWRPNLNLPPIANHFLFEDYQRRANLQSTQRMVNPMALQENPTPAPSSAAPSAGVAMAAPQRPPPPANNGGAASPNQLVGGYFPVRHAVGPPPNRPAQNRF